MQHPGGDAEAAVASPLPPTAMSAYESSDEKAPSVPQLSKMVVVGPDDDKHLCAPDALMKKWLASHCHPLFGSRYRAFLDGFYEDGLLSLWRDRLCGVIVFVMWPLENVVIVLVM